MSHRTKWFSFAATMTSLTCSVQSNSLSQSKTPPSSTSSPDWTVSTLDSVAVRRASHSTCPLASIRSASKNGALNFSRRSFPTEAHSKSTNSKKWSSNCGRITSFATFPTFFSSIVNTKCRKMSRYSSTSTKRNFCALRQRLVVSWDMKNTNRHPIRHIIILPLRIKSIIILNNKVISLAFRMK